MSHAMPYPKETLQAQALAHHPADLLCGTPGKLLTKTAKGTDAGHRVLLAETVST